MTLLRPISVDWIALDRKPGGWAEPYRPSMSRGHDFTEAYVRDGLLYIMWPNGNFNAVPLCHVLSIRPSEWA